MMQSQERMRDYIQRRVGLAVAAGAFILAAISFCLNLFSLHKTFLSAFSESSVWSLLVLGVLVLFTGIFRNNVTRLIQAFLAVIMALGTALDANSGNLTSALLLGIGYLLALEYGFLEKAFVAKAAVVTVIYVAALVTGLTVMNKIHFFVAVHTMVGISLVIYLILITLRVRVSRYRERQTELEREVKARTVKLEEEIRETNRLKAELEVLLEEKDLLLREVHHRTKNNMQIISSMLSLENDRLTDTRAMDALNKSMNRIKALSIVHENLYHSKNISRINMKSYLEDLIMLLWRGYSTDNVTLDITIEGEVHINIDFALPLGLLFNELVSNALKHAFPDNRTGRLTVRLASQGENITLEVRDDGIGMPDLSEVNRSESLGIELILGLIKQLRGTYSVILTEGTAWRITFSLEKLYNKRAG